MKLGIDRCKRCVYNTGVNQIALTGVEKRDRESCSNDSLAGYVRKLGHR